MKKKPGKISSVSRGVLADKIRAIAASFPEALAEGKVDFEKLRESLGDLVDDQPDRFTFSWAGRRNAIRISQIPSRAALVPVEKESLDFERTQNVFIEGENHEVLKLLYKSYFGRVKMIYIDPPYNTGGDFIYPDNFADPIDTYLKITGQKDSAGNLLTSNPETGGRFHSNWLSMMYPRLLLARQLLDEDGVIFVSIDDNEAQHLRMLMTEIFGGENFIAQLVWEKGRKNDAKLFSVGHEYMMAYARSLAFLREKKTVWREPKPGAAEIWEQYLRLREKYGGDYKALEKELREWYQRLPKKHPSKALSRYKHVDKDGPWRDRDISWPGGGGPTYDVIHPKTKKPCKVPDAGWRFPKPEEMERQIKLGLVVFRDDHTQPPFRKAHLRPVMEELDEDEGPIANGEEGEEDAPVGMQVMPSVIYKQSQVAVKYLRKLFGAKVFDNPKDHEILAKIIRYCTSSREHDIILDFFGGSCATAEAVLSLNREDKGNRRFIMVQLPETTPAKSEARKAGYRTVSDLGKERIRRVIAELRKSTAGKLDLDSRGQTEDLGFRVFKLAESIFKRWDDPEEKDAVAYAGQIEMFSDPLVPGWKPKDLIWEVALKEGFGLNTRIEVFQGAGEGKKGKGAKGSEPAEGKGNMRYRVVDPDKGQSFVICLDDKVGRDALAGLDLKKDAVFVCRDCALDDETASNLAAQCVLKTI